MMWGMGTAVDELTSVMVARAGEEAGGMGDGKQVG